MLYVCPQCAPGNYCACDQDGVRRKCNVCTDEEKAEKGNCPELPHPHDFMTCDYHMMSLLDRRACDESNV